MKLPVAPQVYSPRWAAEYARRFDALVTQVQYTGRDVEIASGRLILTSPDGTRYSVTVDNAGNLSTTSI